MKGKEESGSKGMSKDKTEAKLRVLIGPLVG